MSQRAEDTRRPVPDEAEIEKQPTGPQPEHGEPRLEEPVSLRDLSFADWRASLVRAAKESLADNVPMLASALAYSTFLAIPSVLLVATGAFTLLAGPDTIRSLIDHFGTVVPAQATELLSGSLQRLNDNPSAGLTMTIVGFVLALWATTSAMTTYMIGLNMAYDREDQRNFVVKRLVAVAMVAIIGIAFALVAVLLILGPPISHWLADATGLGAVVTWAWWIAQWPILLLGLLAAFATLLYLGPDVDHPRWQFLTAGSLVAVLVWLAASGGFAVYTSMFGSYNKTWGSLAAVIVMLMWLWLTGIALLFGAELNAEVERSRELRRGEPAGRQLQAPHRA